MAQKKAHEVDAWIARPDPRMRLILVYGPDRGLVSERTQRLAAKTGVSLDDPFSVVRLEAAELEQSPGKLIDEARTMPMFVRERLIWVRGGGSQKGLAEEITHLVTEPPQDALVLIEAGDLKKNAPLRTSVEGGAFSITLPCYADDSRGIDGLIDEELGKAGLTITLEARQALKTVLGGDRLATRGELQKLALFSRGRAKIGVEEVTASVGDVAALSSDEAIDALLAGNVPAVDHAFSRMFASGTAPASLLGTALRQFHALQIMRKTMDTGNRSAVAAVAAAKPPIFFARRKTIELALERWSSESISRALSRLQATVLETRRRPELLVVLVRQAMLALAIEGARFERQR